MEEIQILKQFVEALELNDKEEITQRDMKDLRKALESAGEFSIAEYVDRLGSPSELEDLIVNNLY